MTWTVAFEKVTPSEDEYADFELAKASSISPDLEAWSDEMLNAWRECSFSAIDIIESGKLGKVLENSFSVKVIGHSNPDHKPRPGWSNDFVTITIQQL